MPFLLNNVHNNISNIACPYASCSRTRLRKGYVLDVATTSLWKGYVLNVTTQQLACAIRASQHSQQHQQHNFSIRELSELFAYGEVMFLMLPTTSLWKSYVLNDATQQQAYASLA